MKEKSKLMRALRSKVPCTPSRVYASDGVLMGSLMLGDIRFFKGTFIVSFQRVLSDLLQGSFKCQGLGHCHAIQPAMLNSKTR